MKPDQNTESEIRDTMGKWFDAYARKDVDAYVSMLVPDEDAAYIGSGVDEKFFGRESIRVALERDFGQFESIEVKVQWISCSAVNDVAWVVNDVGCDVVAKGEKMQLYGRQTTVMEKRDGKWMIAHSHFSLPVGSGDPSSA